MIINRDGKLFGKISIIDIAVVLIVVVLIAGIYVRFSGKAATSVVTDSQKVECIFLVKNVRMYTVEALQKSEKVYDKTSKEYIGDVTDVTYEEGMYQVNMADGSFKPVAPEERYNVYVTVVFDGKTSNDGYYTKANKYLSTGTSLVFNTKYAQCESTVYSIGEAE